MHLYEGTASTCFARDSRALRRRQRSGCFAHWGLVLILRPSTTVPHASHSARGGTSAPPIGFAGLLNLPRLSVNHNPFFGRDVLGLLAGELAIVHGR
jgi:hypothetical protein